MISYDILNWTVEGYPVKKTGLKFWSVIHTENDDFDIPLKSGHGINVGLFGLYKIWNPTATLIFTLATADV